MGLWGFSGFFSKDSILIAAQEHNTPIFCLALFTAFLTAYYMTRLFVVVFLGTPRSEQAGHAHEVPALMWVPLVLLAIPSAIGGYGFFIHRFLPTPEHAHSIVPILASGVALLGIAIGFVLYKGKAKDPVVIPALINKLYFDEIYAVLIRYSQDLLARVSGFVDRWILDGLIVRGSSGGAWGFGFCLRFLQFGNLQGYAFLFGAGVVALFYFVIFK
jgi:NADH-quinone oxidoreductase subunit L